MKKYDVIAIGTGSAMSIVEAMRSSRPGLRAAVIDKDEPGGICLTKACIPTKMLTYPADVVLAIEGAKRFGIDASVKKVDFSTVMKRMREHIGHDMAMIKRGLTHAEGIDFYQDVARFVSPYTLRVGGETIRSEMMLLCTGSRPLIPKIGGLEEAGYHTSDTILSLTKLPQSLIIIGGGYIAAEYGHFFSAMGSKVTIIGRNPQFLKNEEPEVSELSARELGRRLDLITGHEVVAIEKGKRGKKMITARNGQTGKTLNVSADELLIASGRASNSDLLDPGAGGIKTDDEGWIVVNERFETSQPNVWAFGDAIGGHLFKHVANAEARVVYYNAVLGRELRMDYHAVPHAVFSDPEVAGVGMTEAQAVAEIGKERVLIGFQRYEDTAKGSAMDVKDYFVKVVLERGTRRILGASIIGPQASVLIQEVINLMYTREQDYSPITEGMHIHPSLSEVVERAFHGLMPVDNYHHMMQHGHPHSH